MVYYYAIAFKFDAKGEGVAKSIQWNHYRLFLKSYNYFSEGSAESMWNKIAYALPGSLGTLLAFALYRIALWKSNVF